MRRVFQTIWTVVFVALGSHTAGAQSAFFHQLITHLDEYKASRKLPHEQRWFASKVSRGLENELGRYIFQEILHRSLDRLRDRLKIRYLRINERYDASDLNIFILSSEDDPHKVLERVRAEGNAVSFPQARLVIIDEALLRGIVDADFSVSTDSIVTDFLVAKTANGQSILSLQILNSIRGVKTPAIVLNSQLDQAFIRLKTYTGFLIILHEIGHVYYEHTVHSASYFRPGKEAENVEIEADNFATSIIDALDYTKLKDVIFAQLQMGVAATLSHRLRKNYGAGIAEYYHNSAKDNQPIKLTLKYRLLSLHPPLEYRLLLLNSKIQNKASPEATNPYQKIVDELSWTWSLL